MDMDVAVNAGAQGVAADGGWWLMPFERAEEINRALTGAFFHHMGLRKDPPDISGYSLLEMVVASKMMRGHCRRNADGTTTHYTNCDDRLVAAMYAWAHHRTEFDGEPNNIFSDRKTAIVMAKVVADDGED